MDLIIHGNGQQKRNYVCAEDLGYGSLFALEKKATNKIITLVSKRDTKIIDLARMIIKITKSKSKIFFVKKKRNELEFKNGKIIIFQLEHKITFHWKFSVFKPTLLIEISRLRAFLMILGLPQTSIHSFLEDVLANKIENFEIFHFLNTFWTYFYVYMGGRGSYVAPKS